MCCSQRTGWQWTATMPQRLGAVCCCVPLPIPMRRCFLLGFFFFSCVSPCVFQGCCKLHLRGTDKQPLSLSYPGPPSGFQEGERTRISIGVALDPPEAPLSPQALGSVYWLITFGWSLAVSPLSPSVPGHCEVGCAPALSHLPLEPSGE